MSDQTGHPGDTPTDPVLARRDRVRRLAERGQRLGYVCIGVAVAAFVAAAITSFAGWAVTVTLLSLLAATIVLPPAIVLGYGVKKAEREDPATGR